MIKKRTISFIVGVSLLIVLVVGVSSAETQFKGVTITMAGLVCPQVEATKTLLPQFEKETGIKVIVDAMPYLTLREKQVMELTGRTGAYDLIMSDLIWIGEYSRFLLPLEDYIKKTPPEILDMNDYMPRLLDGLGMWKGTLYCLPYYPGVQILYYRKDLFTDPANKAAFKAKYGYDLAPPETWEQFRDVAEFFTRDYNGDGEIDFWGFASAYARGEHIVCDFLTRLWGFGGEFIDKNWKPVFNNDIGLKALRFYIDTIKYGPPGMTSYAHDETTTAMLEGKVAMIIQWTGYATQMQNPKESKVVGRIDYAVVPGKAPTLGGWGLGICKDSRHPDAAWEFLKWMTGKRMAKPYAMIGGGVVRYSTFHDPDVREKYPLYTADLSSYELVKMRPRIPEYPKISEVFALELSEAVAGRKSPEKALNDAAKQITEILRKAGYYR